MTVALIDLGFLDHEKLEALEGDPRLWADAVALWFAALLYAGRRGNGVIAATRIPRIASPMPIEAAKLAAAGLVSCGLWEKHPRGYQIHDFDDWRPLVEEWLAWRSGGPVATHAEPSPSMPRRVLVETPAAIRARRARARKRDGQGVTERDGGRDGGSTEGVTRHAPSVTVGVTDGVTERDGGRDAVPPSQTLPSLRSLSQSAKTLRKEGEKEERENARERDAAGVTRHAPSVTVGVTDGVTVTSERHADRHGDRHASSRVEGGSPEPWMRLALGYRDRYEPRKNAIWQSWAAHQRWFEAGARWVEDQAKKEGTTFEAVAAGLLDGLFADEWATSNGWPPKQLASKPGELYRPSKRSASDDDERAEIEAAKRRAVPKTRPQPEAAE